MLMKKFMENKYSKAKNNQQEQKKENRLKSIKHSQIQTQPQLGKNKMCYKLFQEYLRQRKQGSQDNLTAVLKQKYNQQQVSCLYSEHIYKTYERDYLLQVQLQKYKSMLETEKKQKMQLLAEQNEWKIEKSKLLQQKDVIIFALDSLLFKYDNDHQARKKKDTRRQTAETSKTKTSSGVLALNKTTQSRFRTESEKEWRTNPVEQQNSDWQKMKTIMELREKFSPQNSSQLKKLYQSKGEQIKLFEIEKQNKFLKDKVETIQKQIMQAKQAVNKLQEYEKKLTQKDLLIEQLKSKLEKQEQKYYELSTFSARRGQELNNLKDENKQLKLKLEKVENELKIAVQQFQEREEKEKKHIQILKKFSNDLKISNQKIQQFLKNEIQAAENIPGKEKSIQEAYNQHLSYVLHLFKKKENLYEDLVEKFKQKVKQDSFFISILQKKLNNYSRYQQTIRNMVLNQSQKDLIYRAILRFGH